MHKSTEIGLGSDARPVLQARPGSVDPQWLSATIGAIYDCVLAPERWEATITSIARHFSFTSAALGVIQSKPGSHELLVHFGFDEAWIALGNTYIDDSINLWGGAARLRSYPIDEPIMATDVRPREQFSNFAYYRDVLQPRGCSDAIMIALARNAGLTGYLALNRHFADGPILPEQVHGLRLLAPHIRRAVTISNFFDLKAIDQATFRSVLESLSCAILLVDEHLDIVHANAAAESLISDGAYLDRTRGKLNVVNPLAQKALSAAVQVAAVNEALLEHRGLGIPLQAQDGSPAVMHVLPLHRGAVRRGLVQRAVAAVFIVLDTQQHHTAVDAISLLYELSPAERQVFAGIAEGRTIADTADGIGIAKSTARTHLLRVFAKTGCSRQAELVALAARLSLAL